MPKPRSHYKDDEFLPDANLTVICLLQDAEAAQDIIYQVRFACCGLLTLQTRHQIQRRLSKGRQALRKNELIPACTSCVRGKQRSASRAAARTRARLQKKIKRGNSFSTAGKPWAIWIKAMLVIETEAVHRWAQRREDRVLSGEQPTS